MMLETLAHSPVLTLFLVIGIGYLVGEASLFGFRLGVAGVLFAGLAFGALSKDLALPEIVSTLGLIIFVYSIGIQSGPAFFAGLKRQGARYSLLAVGGVALGAAIAALLGYLLHLNPARAAGLFCGALTNTPALAAAQERLRSAGEPAGDVTVAYSVAYPFGVVGVLLCFQFARRFFAVAGETAAEASEILVRDFVVKNPGVAGRTIEEILSLHRDPGFVVSRVSHAGRVDLATPDTRLALDDIVAVVGEEEALERAQQIFGQSAEERIEEDRSQLDYRRVFVSSPEVVGRRIRDLDLERTHRCTITRLRRGDIDLAPAPDTILEYGDRVRVVSRRENFAAVAKLFGDSIRGTAETDFGSVALGMVLGVLLGNVPLPLPGGAVVRLGLAGGPLLAALVLGKLERTGRLTWTIPLSANLTLRQVGLLLFLATVGTRAGAGLLQTLQENGVALLAVGALITVAVAGSVLLLGRRWRIPLDELMGVVAGVQTQPACLAYAANLTRTDRPNVGYAAVYPAAMIAKIVFAQLLVGLAF
jgi:putative transport protein